MRCTSPMTVGFLSDGKTLTWSAKKRSLQFAPFQLPCGKCLSCRLQYAQETAVRCVHEASMYPQNCFLTLTYNEENLGDNKLDYKHIQTFIKDLRNQEFSKLLKKLYPENTQSEQREKWNSLEKEERETIYEKIRISTFVCGEYGSTTKRMHWHLLLFNWSPEDGKKHRSTERGDIVYVSKVLNVLWPRGLHEYGKITFESAGYTARYSTKKLVHGKDDEHNYKPISRRSCKNAIGKKWLEKYWQQVFDHGYITILKDGKAVQTGIPRYYEKWLQKNKPDEWQKYIVGRKQIVIEKAEQKEALATKQEKLESLRRGQLRGLAKTRKQVEDQILKEKIKRLQTNQKF